MHKIKITYGIGKCPFGWCVLALCGDRICALSFLDSKDRKKAEMSVRESWPEAELGRDDSVIVSYIEKIFSKKKGKDFPLLLKGTEFQMKIWQVLLSIPFGKTVSYSDISKAIKSPKAVRAVGTACGKNPISFIVPCHRVLTSAGALGGYNSGIKRKKNILEWEAGFQTKR